MDEKGLGRRLQAARQSAGLTQQMLCQKANLSYSTLTKIERGAIKSPSIFTIENIANALNLSLDELLGHQAPTANGPKQRLKSKSGVSFIYFDVNGCLVQSYQKAFINLAQDSGQPADVVETAFWHFNDQACRGDMDMPSFNAALAQQLHMQSVDWAKYYLEAIEPVPHMDELVKWAAEYYGVGLMTNIMPGLLNAMLERHIVPNVTYESVLDSSEIHAIKPEQQIYTLAIERANQRPEEILLVDDSRTNLMAAEKCGLHVMWFDDSRPEESARHLRESLEPAEPETASPTAASEDSALANDPAGQTAAPLQSVSPAQTVSQWPASQSASFPG